MTPMMAVARPTRSEVRPRPPVNRNGRCDSLLSERGVGRKRKIRALNADRWSARRWWVTRVRMTFLENICRKDRGIVAEERCGGVWVGVVDDPRSLSRGECSLSARAVSCNSTWSLRALYSYSPELLCPRRKRIRNRYLPNLRP